MTLLRWWRAARKIEAGLLKAQQDYMRAYKGAEKILKTFQE